MAKRKVSKKQQRFIADQRIKTLFHHAEMQAKIGNFLRANRYVLLACKIAMKNRSPIPSQLKRKYCRSCYHYFYSDKTCRVRINHGKLVMYCMHCHKITRIPLKEN